MCMKTLLIEDYMTPAPHAVNVAQTVGEARSVMRCHHVRHLPVLDGSALAGVVSERDLGTLAANRRLDEVMSGAPYTASATTPLEVAARHMSRHKLGSCVVVEANRVVGMFTTTDGLRALAEVLDVTERVPPRLERTTVEAAVAAREQR